MVYTIIVGRSEEEKKKYGEMGTIYLGKLFVQMGQTTSLSSHILMDIAKTHVVLISGKRGSGKSYSSSVIAEEISRLPEDVKENMAVLFFDTMGVFWTMKYPNKRQEDLLRNWDLKPESIPVTIFTPQGYFDDYKKREIPVDFPFSLKTSELTADDWMSVFAIKPTEPVGILIERIINGLQTGKKSFSIHDIIHDIQQDKKSSKEVKEVAENFFTAADHWGLFAADGTPIEDLMKPGSVNVLDISAYTGTSGNWSIKGLVIHLVCKRLLEERIIARKSEEVEDIKKERSLFSEEVVKEKPMVWLVLDECVTGDTEIITNTNHTKMKEVVDKVKAGQEVFVLSYDDHMKKYVHKKINKVYIIPNRNVVKITTECGREIKCTPDHPLLTEAGYMSAVSCRETAYPLVQHHSEDISATKARLFGYLFGDGWLCVNESVGFSGKKSLGDLSRIKEDLLLLGFKSSRIHSRITTSKIKPTSGKIALVKGISNDICLSRKAFRFFLKLGAPVGEKVLQKVEVPRWILHGSHKVKAEFLAGLMGSDGQKISGCKNARGDFNAIRLSFNKDKRLREGALVFTYQLKKMFDDFGITISRVLERTGNIRKDGVETIKIVLTIAKNVKNTIRFLEKIGYRYNCDKELQGLYWLEYLRAREFERKKRETIKKEALKLKRGGLGKTRVSRMLNIKEYEAREYLYFNYNKGVPKNFDSFEEWIKKRQKGNFIFEKVVDMQHIGKEDVYDITVDDTHNFIANSILSHNCHEFLPKEGKTIATDALVQLLREGRQPGISLILVTQQPGEVHKDVLTQSDIVISHRLTAKPDIEALNAMQQSYLLADIQKYLNVLPKERGAAIILDDTSERIYPVMVHPKRSWHGGEAPSALKIKKNVLFEL